MPEEDNVSERHAAAGACVPEIRVFGGAPPQGVAQVRQSQS